MHHCTYEVHKISIKIISLYSLGFALELKIGTKCPNLQEPKNLDLWSFKLVVVPMFDLT